MKDDVDNYRYHTKMRHLCLSSTVYAISHEVKVSIEHYHEFNPYSLVLFPVTFQTRRRAVSL